MDALYFSLPYTGTVAAAAWALAALPDGREVVDTFNGVQLVVQRGASGYDRCLVLDGLRVYVSKREDMGIWVQCGSALCAGGFAAVCDTVDSVFKRLWGFSLCDVAGDCTITRVDLAVDVAAPMPSLQQFETAWVGRSSLHHVYYGKKRGEVESIYCGSPSSDIQLNVYNKLKKYDVDDLPNWKVTEERAGDKLLLVDADGVVLDALTRWEWRIKAKSAGFGLTLANYEEKISGVVCSLYSWGRVTEPDPCDSNRRRWSTDPWFFRVWKALFPGDKPARRSRKPVEPLAKALRRMQSYVAGVVARVVPSDVASDGLDLDAALDALAKLLLMGDDRGIDCLRDRHRRLQLVAV